MGLGRLLRVGIGFLFAWFVLDRSAALLGSYRGEFGLLVCILTVTGLLAVEAALFRNPPRVAISALGFGTPDPRGLAVTAVLCAALLSFYPAYMALTGVPLGFRTDGWLLVAGLFAQGGVAEETLFRGYLFRRFREGRGFWQAAWLSAVPFIAVHLLLFATMDWPIALASVLLSFASTFWFARLFELGGGTIWAPALAHFVVQGSIKLVAASEADLASLSIPWMILTAILPWAVFAVRPRQKATG